MSIAAQVHPHELYDVVAKMLGTPDAGISASGTATTNLSITEPTDVDKVLKGMRELGDLGRLDPLAAWMAEQGFDPQDGGRLVLPSSMLHLATHLSPRYVIVSPFALEPMLMIDELVQLERASLYVSSAKEVTPRLWFIGWEEFVKAIRRIFSRK